MIASKSIISLGIILTEEMKYLYSENYKTLMKETENTNIWNDILCSWIVRINISKSSILPKDIYRFSAFPSKI